MKRRFVLSQVVEVDAGEQCERLFRWLSERQDGHVVATDPKGETLKFTRLSHLVSEVTNE